MRNCELGLGYSFKDFKTGEIIKMRTEGNKLRERPRVAITHIEYNIPNFSLFGDMIALFCHLYKHTKENIEKRAKRLIIG